jgi:nucleoside-diphosphate-sugar epimerase
MEKDDFKYQLSFGEDVFGGPRWCDLVGPRLAAEYRASGAVPVMLDPQGSPVKRNFVHVKDLVAAILRALDHPGARRQTFNICMDEPVDYRELAEHLAATRQLPSVEVPTQYHSTWLDNTKAKLILGWRPQYDLPRLADEAYDYVRSADDPRVIYYPG